MAYEIIIRNDTANGGNAKSPIAGSGAQATDTTAQQGGTPAISAGRVAAAKGIFFANSYIMPFVDKMVSQKISTVALRTGAQELEDRLSGAYQVGKQAFGFVESVAVGALVGNLPGAIIGGAMSLALTAVEYSNRQQKIDLQHSVEDIGLNVASTRMGNLASSFNGSRSKNQ